MEKYKKVIPRIIYIICIILLLVSNSGVMAATESVTPTVPQEADMSQYFELGATQIKEVEGQNKQVIMELWGYNLEFKRI